MTNEEITAAVKAEIAGAMAKNQIITVEFVKKDGMHRVMQLHRSKALEGSTLAARGINLPSVAKRHETNRANNNLGVEELTYVDGVPHHQFRTISCDRVLWIRRGGETIHYRG